MYKHNSSPSRILAVDLFRNGVGFAVFEGRDNLQDSGLRGVKNIKHHEALRQIEDLICWYSPSILVLEDCPPLDSRRCKRIQGFLWSVIALASSKKLRVYRFTRKRVKETFEDVALTKQA